MSDILLRTKLYIPQLHPAIVPRPRLIERLNQALTHPLTLIAAPAGFGKTTLLSAWARQLDTPVAWLSLDDNDNQAVTFLAYLVAALQTTTPGIGASALAMLQSPQAAPMDGILAVLINELAQHAEPVVLVLDDYQFVAAQPVHSLVASLLEHVPPQMHVILSTRSDPPFPLARLRGRGQIVELRATDLRFNDDEVILLLNQVMGITLTADHIATIEARTEGWATALQMVAMSLQSHKEPDHFVRALATGERYILDYLLEEVLQQQPDDIQDLLLQTSILQRLTMSLCNAVTGREIGQNVLETLERLNLFLIPLDDEGHWYRYHHLFADLLRLRLQQLRPDLPPALYRRASEWCAQQGLFQEAIEYALSGRDYGQAAHLIDERARGAQNHIEQATFLRWLKAIPAEFIRANPRLCIVYAAALSAAGQLDAAERQLDMAEHAPGIDTHPDRAELIGMVAALRAYMAHYRGELPAALEYARRALAVLPDACSLWRSGIAMISGDLLILRGELQATQKAYSEAIRVSRVTGNIFTMLTGMVKLAQNQRYQGQLRRAQMTCQEAIDLANDRGFGHMAITGGLHTILGGVLCEWNQLDAALLHAQKGADLSEQGCYAVLSASSLLVLAQVLLARDDVAGAERVMRQLDRLAGDTELPPWLTNRVIAWKARLWLAQERQRIRCHDPHGLSKVAEWLHAHDIHTDGPIDLLHGEEYLVLARSLSAQGDFKNALQLLARIRDYTHTIGWLDQLIEVLALQAMTFEHLGNTQLAVTTLAQALALAEPEGYVQVFVHEGPSMAHLLYQAAAQGLAPEYTARLLAAFPTPEPLPTVRGPAGSLIEPLSERETEVLRLIAEGCTNQEIAQRLFITLRTVKWHTGQIYAKLAVRNRTQALAKARTLGVLPME